MLITSNPTRVRMMTAGIAAIDAFTTGSESLAAGGGTVVMEIISKLSPEERKLLAVSIRDRAARADGRKRN